jgi:hypothetical protein
MPRPSLASLLLIPLLVFRGAEAAAETATIRGVSRIYLRTGPGTSHEPDGVVVEGEPLTTIERTGSWVKVQTADGRIGYVYSGYLFVEVDGGSPQAASAVEDPPGAPTPPAEVPPAAPPVAVAELGTGEPAAAAGPDGDSLREEITMLKAEVERLKSEVAGGTRVGAAPVPGSATVTARSPTRGPASVAPGDEEGVNLRTAGVALFSLVLGWIFGAGFSRRRSRSQRGRLRF